MNKLIIFGVIIFCISCSFLGNGNAVTNTVNAQTMIVDTTQKDTNIMIHFNYFNTDVEVFFTDTKKELSVTQKRNLDNFKLKQDSLAPEIMKSIFEFYKDSYSDYKAGWLMAGKMSEEELEQYLPRPSTFEALKPFIKPAVIHIQSSDDCEIGTIGIEFDCEWDIENGLGVLIKDWKVVEASVAEISYF